MPTVDIFLSGLFGDFEAAEFQMLTQHQRQTSTTPIEISAAK